MISVTIKFGANRFDRQFEEETEVSEILENDAFQTAFGFGDNVVARINGNEVDEDYVLEDGDVMVIETKINKKQ